jgi:hypothetical protein
MANHNPHIPPVERPVYNMPVRFSFKHLDFDNPKFLPSECCTDYFVRFFETLRKFSAWRVGDFIDQNNNERRHIINFEQSSEPGGFQNVPGLDPDQQWNRWRAHGILLEDTFYIIWFDEHHNLFP